MGEGRRKGGIKEGGREKRRWEGVKRSEGEREERKGEEKKETVFFVNVLI